jgi:hypothetical protein
MRSNRINNPPAVGRPSFDAAVSFKDSDRNQVCEAKPPIGEIPCALNAQDGKLSELEFAVSKLRERLDAVLIPTPNVENPCDSHPTSSPIGGLIVNHNVRISNLKKSISSITNQLAL